MVIVWFWNFIFNICTTAYYVLHVSLCRVSGSEGVCDCVSVSVLVCVHVSRMSFLCFKTIDKPSDWRSLWRAAATSICDPFYSHLQPYVVLPERRAAIFHHTTSASISSCGRTACSGNCAITSGRSPTRVATKGITLMA